MSQDVATATRDILEAGFASLASNIRPQVFLGRVTVTPRPQRYIILTVWPARYVSETYGTDMEVPDYRIRATIAAGLAPTSTGSPLTTALGLLEQVNGLLIGAHPLVDGKQTGWIRHLGTTPNAVDEQITDQITAFYVGDYAVSVT